MEAHGRKELHRLVQLYHMPAVLQALADIARLESLEFRVLRDAAEFSEDARLYRRAADRWERLYRNLLSNAARLHTVIQRELEQRRKMGPCPLCGESMEYGDEDDEERCCDKCGNKGGR